MKNAGLTLLLFIVSLISFGQARHVVVIGLDGFGAYAVPQADMPNLKGAMQQGSWTLKARSVLPSSSAVNWASLIMGAGPTLHGYTEWDSAVPEIPSADTTDRGIFPSIFSLLKEQKPNSYVALIHSWSGIGPLVQLNTTDYRYYSKDNDEDAVEKTVEIIKSKKPTFTFIHIDEPDGVGHKIGHRTPEYYEKLKVVDGYLGQIFQAVKDAGIEKETVILITADHGGTGKGHGGKTMDEVEIPWVIFGKGIKANYPIKGVVANFDTAPTLARILKLKTPQSWRGVPVNEVFK